MTARRLPAPSAGYAPPESPAGAGTSPGAPATRGRGTGAPGTTGHGRPQDSRQRDATGRQALAAAISERDLEEHVRQICGGLGVIYFHVRNPRGMNPGFPDDILIGPRGVLWRECKTQRGKLTAAQVAVGDALEAAGQDYGIWRPDSLLSGRIAREVTAISKLGRAA